MAFYIPYGELSAGARTVDNALTSLMEELEAINYYNQRADVATDSALKDLMIHNRNEEIEHAVMLFEWLRRAMPEFDENARVYVFTEAPLTEVEAAAGAGGNGVSGTSLGIGSLRK